MIVEFECEEFKECICGNTPKKYSMGYGSTPYSLSCKCGKQLFYAKCKITGSINNLISYWNEKLRNLSIDDVKNETSKFNKKKEKAINREGMNPKEYECYWFKGIGEKLIQRW